MNNRFSVHHRHAWGLLALVLIATLVLAGNLPSLAAPLPQDNAPLQGHG